MRGVWRPAKGRRATAGFYVFYVLLLVVILLIWVFSFMQMMGIVEGEAVDTTLAVLARSQQSFDEKLANISKVATRTMMNGTIMQYMRVKQPLRDAEYDLLRQCNDIYTTLTMEEPFMTRSFIFFHESGTFLGDFGASTRTEYAYDFQYRFGHMSFDEWKARLDEASTSVTLWPTMDIASQSRTEAYLPYLYTTYNYRIRSTKATMFALIPRAAVDACFDGIQDIGAEEYFLVDAQGRVLYQSGGDSGLSDQMLADFLRGGGSRHDFYPEGTHKLVIRNSDTAFGIVSIAVLDYAYIVGKLAPMNAQFAAIFSAAALIGVVLALVFAQLSARPMRRISQMLRDYLGEPEGRADPTPSVDSSIHSIIHINRDLATRLDDSRDMLRTTFMQRLFQTGFDSEQELEVFAVKVGISIPRGHHAVVVFHIDLPDEADVASDALERLFHVALERHLEALDIRPVLRHTTALHKMAALFVWNDERTVRDFIGENLAQGQRLNIDGIEIHLTLGVSNQFGRLMDARGAYVEADFALDYINYAPGVPMYFSDITSTAFALHYPLEKEMLLIRLIRGGDAGGATAVIGEIYDLNHTQAPISEQMQHQLTHDMKGTFLRVIGEVAASTGVDMKRLYARIFDIVPALPVEHQIALFTDTAVRLCEAVSASRGRARGAYVDRVLAYVQAHCTDVDLSLNAVADAFQLSPAYLSRQIRLQSSTTFTELLERHRMALAHEYTTQTTMNINEIATRCGYSNANTFFKAFKRTYGTSPSSLRRQHAAHE